MQAEFEKIFPASDSSFRVFTRVDRAFDFRWHYHPEYELTFIVRSRGKRYVGDHIADYRDGDLVLLGPNLPHTWAAPAAGRTHRAVVVQFDRDCFGTAFFRRPELRGVAALLQRARRGLHFGGPVSRRAGRELQRLPRQRGLTRVLTLLRVLDGLAGAADVRPLSSEGFTPAWCIGDQARIDRVCRYIRDHFTERLTLRAVAETARLSPRAFTRFFKRTLGKTLVAYVNELRIGHACALLIATDQSVTEIGYGSGFNNLAHFNRRFLALKKVTPREYRRAYSRAGATR